MFKNTFKLFAAGFINVWKQLLYMFIIILISVGLTILLALPVVEYIKASGFNEMMEEFISSVYVEPEHFAENFSNVVTELWHLIGSGFHIYWANYLIIILLLVFVIKMMYNISYYAIGCVVDGKMSSFVDYSYTNKLVANFKANISYSFFNYIISIPFYFAMVGAGYIYGKLANNLISALAALPLLGFMILVIRVFMKTLFVGMIPCMVTDGVKARHSFIAGIKKIKPIFFKVLSNEVLLSLIEFGAILFFGIFTLGAGLIIVIPMIPVLETTFSFVCYYTATKKRYYLNENLVVNPL